MDSARLRTLCLSMPGAYEDFPFGPDASVFKVRALVEGARHPSKMFALSALDAIPLSVSLKCEPSLAVKFRADHDEISAAYTSTRPTGTAYGSTGRCPIR